MVTPLYRIALSEVSADAARASSELTRPSLDTVASYRALAADFVRLDVSLEGRPVGCLLAQQSPERPGVAELLSLAVLEGHRDRGLATRLVAEAERHFAAQGFSAVEAAWRTDFEGAAAGERVLHKRGWDPPRVHRLLYAASWDWFDSPQGQMLLGLSPPPGCAFGDWDTLTEAERTEVEQRLASDPAAREVSPFSLPDLIEPTASVWLRCGGRLVGWLAVHRVGPRTVQYTALYVHPDHRQRGTALALLAEVLRRRMTLPDHVPLAGQTEPPGRGVFVVAARNAPMRAFADKHLAPACESASELRMAGKRL